MQLTSRMRAALKALRGECDYVDMHATVADKFILIGRLGAGVGDKTISDLLAFGFIEKGFNKSFGEIGYRITETGRKAIIGKY